MLEWCEADLVARTGITAQEIRRFRRGKKCPGVRLKNRRWVWDHDGVKLLLEAFGMDVGVLYASPSKKTPPAPNSSTPAMPVARVLKVIRTSENGIRNHTVLEAGEWTMGQPLPPLEKRAVVKVRDNRRFKVGQDLLVEPMPANPWLWRVAQPAQ